MSNETNGLPLDQYLDHPKYGPLRRDVYEAKYGAETSELAFAFYDLISSWHSSWAEGYSYPRLYKEARRFEVPESFEIFSRLDDGSQHTIMSVIHNCTSWSLYQSLSVFDKMIERGYSGPMSMRFDLRRLFNQEPLNAVRLGVISKDLYAALDRSMRLGVVSHQLVYIVGAVSLYGEKNVIEVLNRTRKAGLLIKDIDLIAILDQWDEVKEYSMDWIINMTNTVDHPGIQNWTSNA